MPAQLVIGVVKTLAVSAIFIVGVLSILASQTVGILFSFGNAELLNAWLSNTKTHFIVLLSTLISFVSKTSVKIRFISPDIPRSKVYTDSKGRLKSTLPPNTVIFANHQIYTDWVFLWWFAYTADLGGFVYIILKDSLRKIPLLGYGMKNYDFIFLSRKWIKDKLTMGTQLARIDANARGKGPASGYTADANGHWPKGEDKTRTWPYSLIIFPEGTNISANTRGKTEAYAAKVGKKPFRHVLLPKTTGLRFSLLQLQDSLDEVYDVTVAYSGVKPDEYGQDIYKLENVLLKGENPETVEIHLRTFKINEIPIGKKHYESEQEEVKDAKIFEDWLFARWAEKDELLDHYYKTGSFIGGDDQDLNVVQTTLTTSKLDFVKIFAVPFIICLLGRFLYYTIQKLL